MENQIQSLIKIAGVIEKIHIFGYCSKGVPGLEVCGLRQQSRLIKEKLIFISKARGVKIPLRRYILCTTDLKGQKIDNREFAWLELPLLILFWNLSGVISIKNLENCLVSGQVSVNGHVHHRNLTSEHISKISYKSDKELVYIHKDLIREEGLKHLSSQELLGQIPNISF